MQDNLKASNLSSTMRMKDYFTIEWKEKSGIHHPYLCSSCRRKLDHYTTTVENVEPCAVGIVPFKEHSFNDCDVCNTKRRKNYNLSVKFGNAVNAPVLEEVCITNFYDFLITTSKQYDDHQLIFDNSSKIVALSKSFNK